MRTVAVRDQAALKVDSAISEEDPAWLAAMSAPFDEAPETEQEQADVAEALASGRFVAGSEVRRSIAARSSR